VLIGLREVARPLVPGRRGRAGARVAGRGREAAVQKLNALFELAGMKKLEGASEVVVHWGYQSRDVKESHYKKRLFIKHILD